MYKEFRYNKLHNYIALQFLYTLDNSLHFCLLVQADLDC